MLWQSADYCGAANTTVANVRCCLQKGEHFRRPFHTHHISNHQICLTCKWHYFTHCVPFDPTETNFVSCIQSAARGRGACRVRFRRCSEAPEKHACGTLSLALARKFHRYGCVHRNFVVFSPFCRAGTAPHITLPALAKKWGGLYSLQLGNRLLVVCADQEACIEV